MSRLTIRRKENQSFYIYVGDKEIQVFITKARGGQTVFSIDADNDVVIKREELLAGFSNINTVDNDEEFLPLFGGRIGEKRKF